MSPSVSKKSEKSSAHEMKLHKETVRAEDQWAQAK